MTYNEALMSAEGSKVYSPRMALVPPLGTPDEIIDKLKTLQWAISLETLVIHVFYGGMPQDKAEKSLRLFAEKVLPAVHDMATPMNPASLGRSASFPQAKASSHSARSFAWRTIFWRVK